MPGLWTYPWNLAAEEGGLAGACADLAERGVDSLSVATHYHSVRAMQPRFPDSLFDARAGGCYFDPDPERFAETPIDPIPNAVGGLDDPLAAVVEAGAGAGLAANAWTVCFHNSRLGAQNPDYRQEDAFGTPHQNALCPSHPEVRRYFAAVVAAAADRGVDAVELESVGWQSVLHGHSTTFGHDKRQALTSDTEEWLLSQCFWDACRERMEMDLDTARAARTVRRILRDSFEDPHSDPPSLAALTREYPVLDAVFDYRADAVAAVFDALAEAAGSVALDYYVMDGFGAEPGAGWPAGVTLDAVSTHCDRATALCYVADPAVARERVRTLSRSVDLPVDAGLTLDPNLVPDEGAFRALVDAVAGEAADVTVYHHGLATEAQLEWIEAAFA